MSRGRGDWLRVGRLRGQSSSPGKVKEFSFLPVVRVGSGVQPASYLMGARGPFPGGKVSEVRS
jgi:hypothetical protein